MQAIEHYRDLRVYPAGMETAMEIFHLSKRFPADEKFSLTDQVRRSSRSVCANLSEAWRKRRYPAAFVAKLNDAETEAGETQVWLEVAFRCGYLDQATFDRLDEVCDKMMAQIVKMIDEPRKWTFGANR